MSRPPTAAGTAARTIALDLLQRAVESPHGIAARTNNVHGAIALLNRVRAEAHDPAYHDFAICPSRLQPQIEVWLYRKTSRLALAQGVEPGAEAPDTHAPSLTDDPELEP